MPDPTAARRNREYRARLKNGIILAKVEITPTLADILIDNGFITSEAIADPTIYGAALLNFIATKIEIRVTT